MLVNSLACFIVVVLGNSYNKPRPYVPGHIKHVGRYRYSVFLRAAEWNPINSFLVHLSVSVRISYVPVSFTFFLSRQK